MKAKYEVFKNLLETHGCRPSDVSKATGINQTVFSDWKSGKSAPGDDKIAKIAEFFDVPYSLFYGMPEEEQNYYYDEETREVAEMLRTDKNYRILFDAARGSKPEDLKMAADLLNRFKETNQE